MAEETTKTVADPKDETKVIDPKAGETKPPASEPKPEPGKSSIAAAEVKEPGKAGTIAGGEEKKVEPAAPVKPAEFKADDLKVPDNPFLDPKAAETLADFSKQHGLSKEQAQQVLERENAAISSYVETQEKSLEQTSVQWVDEIKKDAEFGGDKFKETAELTKRFVTRFGDEQFQKDLNATGFGNHPGLVKMLARAARSMGEDKLVMPGAQPSNTPKSAEEIMFGPEEKKES